MAPGNPRTWHEVFKKWFLNSKCGTKRGVRRKSQAGIPQALWLPWLLLNGKTRNSALGLSAFLTLIPSIRQLLTWYVLPHVRGRFNAAEHGLLPAPMLGMDILVTWSSLPLCESPGLKPQSSCRRPRNPCLHQDSWEAVLGPAPSQMPVSQMHVRCC